MSSRGSTSRRRRSAASPTRVVGREVRPRLSRRSDERREQEGSPRAGWGRTRFAAPLKLSGEGSGDVDGIDRERRRDLGETPVTSRDGARGRRGAGNIIAAGGGGRGDGPAPPRLRREARHALNALTPRRARAAGRPQRGSRRCVSEVAEPDTPGGHPAPQKAASYLRAERETRSSRPTTLPRCAPSRAAPRRSSGKEGPGVYDGDPNEIEARVPRAHASRAMSWLKVRKRPPLHVLANACRSTC